MASVNDLISLNIQYHIFIIVSISLVGHRASAINFFFPAISDILESGNTSAAHSQPIAVTTKNSTITPKPTNMFTHPLTTKLKSPNFLQWR